MKEQEKKKILVVDDESRIRALVRMLLENRGYEVHEAGDGPEALRAIPVLSPDMVILDIMMPAMDGFACCKKIRALTPCPILMLTAKGEDYDQVEGLQCGADDYVIKPFTPMVLAARVEVLFRRMGSPEKRDAFGELRIDAGARSVYVGGEPVVLSRKEFDLLKFLTDNYNISLSRDQILETVWGYDYLGSDNTVDTHINRIRTKLGAGGAYIRTLRGYGYKFEVTG